VIDTEKSLIPSVSWMPGMTVFARQRQVEPDPVVGIADQCGGHGHDQVDGRLAGVRLRGLVQRRGDRHAVDDGRRRRRRGHALHEAVQRRTDPADDDTEPANADIQDAGAQREDRGDQRQADDPGHPAAALDRSVADEARGDGGARLDLDRDGPAGRRWTGSVADRHAGRRSVALAGAVRCTLAGSRA
jgi:hypothetical protein